MNPGAMEAVNFLEVPTSLLRHGFPKSGFVFVAAVEGGEVVVNSMAKAIKERFRTIGNPLG